MAICQESRIEKLENKIFRNIFPSIFIFLHAVVREDRQQKARERRIAMETQC